MSQENTQIVRRVFEALNRGDLDALVEAYDPEADTVTLMLGPYHGRRARVRHSKKAGEICAGGNST